MIETQARGILLDIEGTTSSISFVYDVMYPFVRKNVSQYLADHWDDPAVQKSVAMLAKDLKKESADIWLGQLDVNEKQTEVVAGVLELMDADVKATGLRQLQGLIWKDGFRSGQMVAHLFDDVADSIDRWHQSGADVRIYSSGSIQTQQLFFSHTVAGNLLDKIGGHYDNTTGPKREAASYFKIAQEFNCEPSEILFISDIVAELEAAKEANLQTALSARPGNKPVDPDHGFAVINSFAQIEITGNV